MYGVIPVHTSMRVLSRWRDLKLHCNVYEMKKSEISFGKNNDTKAQIRFYALRKLWSWHICTNIDTLNIPVVCIPGPPSLTDLLDCLLMLSLKIRYKIAPSRYANTDFGNKGVRTEN